MCLNSRWRGFANATKRLATSMTDPGRADRARQLLETTACWSASLQEEWTPATPVSSRTVRRILARNGLHGRIAAQKPALNKRQLRNSVAYAKAHSLTEGWTAENVYFSDESSVELHPKRRQYCRRPSGARLDPRFTQKTVKFGGGKIMVWGYIQYGGAREICKVDGNIDSANISTDSCLPVHSQLQEGSDFSTGWSSLPYLRFHYEVSQGEEDQGPSGMASTVSRYEYYWAYLGNEWRRKLGGPSRRTWRSFGMPARWPSMPSPTTSSTSSTTLPNRMATVLQAKGIHTRYELSNF